MEKTFKNTTKKVMKKLIKQCYLQAVSMFIEEGKPQELSKFIKNGIPTDVCYAHIIELAIKHADYIRRRPELYYSAVPHASMGTSFGFANWHFTVGELVDVIDKVPDAIKTCPNCGHKMYLGKAGGGFGGIRQIYGCPHCEQEWDNLDCHDESRHFMEVVCHALHETTKMNQERGMYMAGVGYEELVKRLLALETKPKEDETDLPKVIAPVFEVELTLKKGHLSLNTWGKK